MSGHRFGGFWALWQNHCAFSDSAIWILHRSLHLSLNAMFGVSSEGLPDPVQTFKAPFFPNKVLLSFLKQFENVNAMGRIRLDQMSGCTGNIFKFLFFIGHFMPMPGAGVALQIWIRSPVPGLVTSLALMYRSKIAMSWLFPALQGLKNGRV